MSKDTITTRLQASGDLELFGASGQAELTLSGVRIYARSAAWEGPGSLTGRLDLAGVEGTLGGRAGPYVGPGQVWRRAEFHAAFPGLPVIEIRYLGAGPARPFRGSIVPELERSGRQLDRDGLENEIAAHEGAESCSEATARINREHAERTTATVELPAAGRAFTYQPPLAGLLSWEWGQTNVDLLQAFAEGVDREVMALSGRSAGLAARLERLEAGTCTDTVPGLDLATDRLTITTGNLERRIEQAAEDDLRRERGFEIRKLADEIALEADPGAAYSPPEAYPGAAILQASERLLEYCRGINPTRFGRPVEEDPPPLRDALVLAGAAILRELAVVDRFRRAGKERGASS